jgi:hypothetical protein
LQTVLVLLPSRFGRPNKQSPALGDDVLGFGVTQQGVISLKHTGAQRGAGLADTEGMLRRGVAAIPPKPGDELGQIAPAQRQRVLRIEQHPRQLPHQAWDRKVGIATEVAGSAERCGLAGTIPI